MASSFAGPMPFTFFSSSSERNGPWLSRYSTMARAVTGPIWGRASRSNSGAVLMSRRAVIGSAVHAVAELIANKLNGLLFKIEKGETMAIPVARLLQNRDAQRKVKVTARGQAYEVFGLRRFAEQHDRLYGNLLAGKPPGEGILDPAEVT